MTMRVTFSPFTANPQDVRAAADAVMQAQAEFAMAAWEAQMQFVRSLTSAALAAQWSVIAQLRQVPFRQV